MIDLNGKVAWVTGGTEGLGLAISRLLFELGAKVAVTSSHKEKVDAAIAELSEMGPHERLLGAAGDVTDADAMAAIVDRIEQELGELDIVVANAGTNGTWGPIEDVPVDDWKQTIDVNLIGTYLTLRPAVAVMKPRRRGAVVIVSSVNGTRTFTSEGASAYATSKAAQLALGKMLALELAQFHIRVNVICPGAFDTGIHSKTKRVHIEEIELPVELPEGEVILNDGRMGDPREVANLTAFLVSDAAKLITGTPVWIDGGSSLMV